MWEEGKKGRREKGREKKEAMFNYGVSELVSERRKKGRRY